MAPDNILARTIDQKSGQSGRLSRHIMCREKSIMLGRSMMTRVAPSKSFGHMVETTNILIHSEYALPETMKLFDRFRRILMRFIFSIPSSSSSKGSHSHPQTNNGSSSSSLRRSCDRPDPPKTSCSTYYSSNTHYNEAIADCIDFFNKSSQESRKSDVMV
ncbi:hypothetical protein LguiB_020169 [Lonicera macranthoides]